MARVRTTEGSPRKRREPYRFNEFGRCRWCGVVAQPPRQLWCGELCRTRYLVAGYARERDEWTARHCKGRCSLCRFPVRLMELCLERRAGMPVWESEWADSLVALGYNRGQRLWQVDHIVPLVDGGLNELENLRLLCVPCHKAETRRLKQELAERKRSGDGQGR